MTQTPIHLSKEKTIALKNSVVVVIGGGAGIGKATAKLLALRGARVAIGDYNLEAAQQAARELSGPAGRVASYQVDVSDPDSVAAFFAEVEAAQGRIDVVINSAGVMWVGKFDEELPSSSRRQIEVNLLGAMNVTREIVPYFRDHAGGRGHLITLGSAASFLPTPGEASYAASEHGILGYLKAVRREIRTTDIELSIVMPTVVDTELAVGTSSGAATLLTPAQIADVIVQTILKPKFEVVIPPYAGLIWKALGFVPASLRDAVLDRMVPDQVKSVDRSARRHYETAAVGDREI